MIPNGVMHWPWADARPLPSSIWIIAQGRATNIITIKTARLHAPFGQSPDSTLDLQTARSVSFSPSAFPLRHFDVSCVGLERIRRF